ncbi:MAG: class I SAM-dependent methyltransferase [Planctomycetes bacterium]|nr:class I SAM-dependent methyltransferase [Planctomycetota bacterium]
MAQSLLIEDRPLTQTLPIEILRCPITRGVLEELSLLELERLNAEICGGRLRHLDGSQVQQTCQAALQTTDGSLVYRIEDGILVLLASLAIARDDTRIHDRVTLPSEDKRAVQDFYDQVGWNKGNSGDFVDAELWEDRRDVAHKYIQKCHMRVSRAIKPAGKYLLDVASGPIQYPEYMSYSNDYKARVCVDISFVALKEAQRKLGAHGIYILGDITNLPMQDGAVDGAVSLHTIYHVPADEQEKAFREIFRVLKPGCTAAVVYCWKSRLIKALRVPARLASLPFRMIRKLGRATSRKRSNLDDKRDERPQKRLYYHAHRYSWLADREWEFPLELRVWRSIDVPLMRAYIHRWLFGRVLLAMLYRMEEWMPRLCGRLGAYPLIVMYKP